jgi:hypothetical protein
MVGKKNHSSIFKNLDVSKCYLVDDCLFTLVHLIVAS